jgi:hypothetical protein
MPEITLRLLRVFVGKDYTHRAIVAAKSKFSGRSDETRDKIVRPEVLQRVSVFY